MTERRRRNIRLALAYDGTGYAGWQRQKNAPSVQGELEAALAKMHGRGIPVFAAGRTDAGVHARAQTANFYTDIASIPAARFVPALNKLLPRDIRVMSAAEAHFDFHSRFDARLRRYRYHIAVGKTVDPFTLRYAHHLRRAPDLRALNEMASALLGETDFTALSSARDPSPSKRRNVLEASFRWEGGGPPGGSLLVFEIAANAFLLRMVRSIVGSLLHWEAEGDGLGSLVSALESGDRSLAGPTAPARGLFFWNAEYYPEPRKPGRGALWSRRGYEDASETETDDEAEDPDEGEPQPILPPTRRRLVPGIGFVEIPAEPRRLHLPFAPRAILFDLDGTLVDSEPLFEASEERLLEGFGIRVDDSLRHELFGRSAASFFAFMAERFPDNPINRLPREELLARKQAAYFESARGKVKTFPAMERIARGLAARGLPLAIASSSTHEIIDYELEATGLAALFPVRVSAVDVPRGKPDPDVFLEAARRLGVAASECLVLEDSFLGLTAAKQAGAFVISLPQAGAEASRFSAADFLHLGGPASFDAEAFLDAIDAARGRVTVPPG